MRDGCMVSKQGHNLRAVTVVSKQGHNLREVTVVIKVNRSITSGQQQIKFTSCLPIVGGSLRVLRLPKFHH
jgi:hypothetical protein